MKKQNKYMLFEQYIKNENSKNADDFFTTQNCDRCGQSLKGNMRKMSWFTEDTICKECSSDEVKIRKQLPDFGRNYEGIGYVPNVKDNNTDEISIGDIISYNGVDGEIVDVYEPDEYAVYFPEINDQKILSKYEIQKQNK